MTAATVIAKRELSSYFFSPLAYVAMVLFLLAAGFSFMDDFNPGQPATMRAIFEQMVWLLVFIIPILSMGLLSQEFATGTVETMMTAPVNDTSVVLGKFLGSFLFYAVLLAPTLLYVALLRIYSRPDYGPIFSGYIGLLLVGALFTAIGLFCSSLTKSQVVAAVSAAAILVLVTIVPRWASEKANLTPFWRNAVAQGVYAKYNDFSKGILDLGSVTFFLAGTAAFLFLTTKVLEARRWK
jgi:ABC-2 type transport system permease protein